MFPNAHRAQTLVTVRLILTVAQRQLESSVSSSSSSWRRHKIKLPLHSSSNCKQAREEGKLFILSRHLHFRPKQQQQACKLTTARLRGSLSDNPLSQCRHLGTFSDRNNFAQPAFSQARWKMMIFLTPVYGSERKRRRDLRASEVFFRSQPYT